MIHEFGVGGSLWTHPHEDFYNGRSGDIIIERGPAGKNLDQPVSLFYRGELTASHLDHDHPECEYVGFLAVRRKAFEDFRCSELGCGSPYAGVLKIPRDC